MAAADLDRRKDGSASMRAEIRPSEKWREKFDDEDEDDDDVEVEEDEVAQQQQWRT